MHRLIRPMLCAVAVVASLAAYDASLGASTVGNMAGSTVESTAEMPTEATNGLEAEEEGPSAEAEAEAEPDPEAACAADAADAAANAGEPIDYMTEFGISVHAPASFLESETYTQLESAIDELCADGCTAGIVMRNLTTGYSVSYCASTLLYPASSIKALWCASLYEAQGGAAGMTKNVARCIEESSNEDYCALTDKYGNKNFSAWLDELGVSDETVDEARTHTYPHICAADMATCWEEIYRYGTSDEPGAEELTSFLSATEITAMGSTLRDRYTVWCKAGWFPADENDLPTTADAGVVFSDSGAYVLVILTNKPADMDALVPVVEALDAAHDALCAE